MADCTLMGAEEPPFEQGHHAVDPRQQLRRRFLAPFQKRDPMLVATCCVSSPMAVNPATRSTLDDSKVTMAGWAR